MFDKKNLFGLLFIAIILLLSACGKANSDRERWQPVEPAPGGETALRSILVEEFTGQDCINCPTAAKLLHKQESLYGERLITVSLHAESTQQTRPELRSDEAEALAKAFGIPAKVPGVMINRQKLNAAGDRYSVERPLWTSLIKEVAAKPALMNLRLSAKKSAGDNLSVTASTERIGSSTALPDHLALTVWVVEDVFAGQNVAGKEQTDYLHRGVLRQALLSEKEFEFGSEVTVDGALSPRVTNADRAKVVAFVSDAETKEILEAAIFALGTSIEETPETTPEEADPETPETKGLTFSIDGKAYEAGSMILASETLPEKGGVVELSSPAVQVTAPGSSKAYDVKVTVLDATGEADHGLKSVCLESCESLTGLPKLYDYKGFRPGEESFVYIHYGLKGEKLKREGSYRVRVAFSRNGEAAGELLFRFDYKPAGETVPPVVEEEHPAEPGETPEPPTDTPEPPVAPGETPEPPALNPDDKSTVVAMDFTGQTCPHCIRAINNLKEQEAKHGSRLITVAIHSEPMCIDPTFPADNRGAYYTNLFGGSPIGLPMVVLNNDKELINCLPYPELFRKTPLLRSKLKVVRKGDYEVRVDFSAEDYADKAASTIAGHPEVNVLFWVIQNDMEGYQAGTSGTYTHQHVYRGSLNGDWGETYTVGSAHSKTYSLPMIHYFDPTLTPKGIKKELVAQVKPDDCEIIAIILDAKTKVFLDAVKVPVR